MTPQHALLRTIRDTPVEQARVSILMPHIETLRALLRKGLVRHENSTLALTDQGRAAIAHLETQNCQGCVWLHVNASLCLKARGSRNVNPVRPSPRWCPGKVRPVL